MPAGCGRGDGRRDAEAAEALPVSDRAAGAPVLPPARASVAATVTQSLPLTHSVCCAPCSATASTRARLRERDDRRGGGRRWGGFGCGVALRRSTVVGRWCSCSPTVQCGDCSYLQNNDRPSPSLPPSLRSCHPPPAAVWRSKARQWHAQVAEEGAGEESVEEEVDRARGAGGRRARWRQRREPRSSSATLVRLPPAADAGRRPEEGETRQEEDVREPERRRRRSG